MVASKKKKSNGRSLFFFFDRPLLFISKRCPAGSALPPRPTPLLLLSLLLLLPRPRSSTSSVKGSTKSPREPLPPCSPRRNRGLFLALPLSTTPRSRAGSSPRSATSSGPRRGWRRTPSGAARCCRPGGLLTKVKREEEAFSFFNFNFRFHFRKNRNCCEFSKIRKEKTPNSTPTEAAIAKELAAGKTYFSASPDSRGRPYILSPSSRHNRADRDLAASRLSLVYAMDAAARAADAAKGGDGRVVSVIDARGIGLANLDPEVSKLVVEVAQVKVFY